MTNFHGIFPYLVSPIDESTGRVRERVVRNLVEHLIACGVHGLSPLGSTGEFADLQSGFRAAGCKALAQARKRADRRRRLRTACLLCGYPTARPSAPTLSGIRSCSFALGSPPLFPSVGSG